MYENRLSQFHPTFPSSGSSRSENASYCAAKPRVQSAPLIELLPPSVFPLEVDSSEVLRVKTRLNFAIINPYPWITFP